MKKEQVKVLINSKKEAKQVKAILKGLGEEISSEFYYDNELTDQSECYLTVAGYWICYKNRRSEELKEISIRDLIILLTKPEEEKVFLITSEDGVRLHVGDDFYCAQILHNGTWELLDAKLTFGEQAKTRSSCVNQPDDYKAFSTKEAAEKWILEKNKPKEIIISGDSTYPIVVTRYKALIKCGDSDNHLKNIEIYPNEIKEIQEAFNNINTQ